MADDKDLERQYRKNLMVVASIVLIYSISGGKMAADLSLFGAKLQFSRPDWLEYAMVVMMCFFWWRHWQVSGEARQMTVTAAGDRLTLMLPKYLMKKLIVRVKAECVDIQESLSISIQDNNVFVVGTNNLRHQVNRNFYISTQGYSISGVTLRNNEGYGFTIRSNDVLFFVLWMKLIVAYSKALIKDPHFGDAILPSITAVVALFSYGVQKLA